MRNYRELPPGAGSAWKKLRFSALLAFLLACSAPFAWAQGSHAYIQHVSAYGGVTLDQGIRNRDLDKLVNSYNQYFQQQGILKTPLSLVRGGTGYYAGISGQLFVMDVGLETSRSSMHTEAEDVLGSGQRAWDFNYQTTALNFTLWLNRIRKAGENSGEKDGFIAEVGIPFSMIMNEHVYLRSGFRYPDGSFSYGPERTLNGIYHFSYGNDMGMGVRVLLGTSRFRLMTEWMAVGLRKRKDPKYGIDLSAKDHLGSVPTLSFPTYLPDDFANAGTQMQITGITAQDKHAAVTPYFQGNRFRFGLLIDIL